MSDAESPQAVYIKPRWLNILTDMVRPGGVALMFLIITLLPVIFALLDVGLPGVGVRMASVLASYFTAIPNVYYDTLQVMFMAYVFGKSAEQVATGILNKKVPKNVNVNQGETNIDQSDKPNAEKLAEGDMGGANG